jgi:hypothetical protein
MCLSCLGGEPQGYIISDPMSWMYAVFNKCTSGAAVSNIPAGVFDVRVDDGLRDMWWTLQLLWSIAVCCGLQYLCCVCLVVKVASLQGCGCGLLVTLSHKGVTAVQAQVKVQSYLVCEGVVLSLVWREKCV